MHNGQLADPLNYFTKEMKKVSGKRAKTEADFEQMARIEFLGGLYLADGEPCIPGELIEAAFTEAARKRKRGQQAKAGILADGMFPLMYDGPRKPEELWQNEAFRLTTGVKVQRNRIMRTRPLFREWVADIHIDYQPSILNKSEVMDVAALMGAEVGLGDWRPKFGRFRAEVVQ
jgi:hypothetical protein